MDRQEKPIKIISSKITSQEYKNASRDSYYVKKLKLNMMNKRDNEKNITKSLQDLSDMNYYETTYKKITITISKSSSISTERHVAVNLVWKIMPSVRSYDILGMRSSNGFFIQNTEYGTYTYTLSANSECNVISPSTFRNTFNYGNSAWNNKNLLGVGNYYGIGFTHKLQNNLIACYNDIGTPQISTVTAMSSFISATASAGNNNLTVYASYQHATSSVAYNDVVHSYNFNSSGLGGVISFNNGMGSYYDGMGGVSLSY